MILEAFRGLQEQPVELCSQFRDPGRKKPMGAAGRMAHAGLVGNCPGHCLTRDGARAFTRRGAAVCAADEAAVRSAYHSPLALAFSPDGRILAVADHTAGLLVRLDTQTGKLLGQTELPGQPAGVAWSARRLDRVCDALSGQPDRRTGQFRQAAADAAGRRLAGRRGDSRQSRLVVDGRLCVQFGVHCRTRRGSA